MSTELRARRRELLALIVIIALGVAARLQEVTYNFDGDEVFSAQLADHPFGDVIALSLSDTPHPPLYNILLHVWLKVFGPSEPAARALSVLFSAAFLYVSFRLFRGVVPSRLALAATSILAVSPLFVYFGQQARPYALVALLSSCNLVAFLRLLEDPLARRRRLVWCASCALLLYSQYIGAVVIACEGLVALVCLRTRKERLAIAAYGAMAGVSILPWVAAAIAKMTALSHDPLGTITWIAPPTQGLFAWLYLSVFGDVPGIARELLIVPFVVLGVAHLRRLLQSRRIPVDHMALYAVGILVPAIVFIVSAWGPQPVFAIRQLLGSATAFVGIVALALAALPRPLAAAFVVLFLAWTAVAVPQALPHNMKPPWREIAARVDASPVPTVAGQEHWVLFPLAHYRRAGHTTHVFRLPEAANAQGFLFVCRPVPISASQCSEIETGSFAARRVLLATWRWGGSVDNEVRLYAIGAAGSASTMARAAQ